MATKEQYLRKWYKDKTVTVTSMFQNERKTGEAVNPMKNLN
jgi:hypothetical protein